MAGGFFDLTTPTFRPTIRLISSITKGSTTTITTDKDHGYLDGMIVRILVPTDIDTSISPIGPVGMTQINKLSGKITVTGSNIFTIDIDSTNFDSFSIPSPWPVHTGLYPMVVPFAEDASMDTAAVTNVLT